MTASFIYFVQVRPEGPIKIGVTSHDPRRRMVKIQTDCPWPIKLLGAIHGDEEQEKKLHRKLAAWRTQGEWFEAHPSVIATVFSAIENGKKIDTPITRRVERASRHPLTQYRLKNSLTLEALAKQLGCGQPFLSMIERGQRTPSLALAVRMHNLTGIGFENFAKAGVSQ